MILSLDTSTTVCSIAITDQGRILSEQNFLIEKSHSALLPLAIDTQLKYSGVEKSDLKAVAISGGPGSYTGLRIGTSTAKGLCYALDIPLIAVNTLFAMAAEARKYNLTGDLLVPMLDARRMEVYTMILDNNLQVIKDTYALVLEENSFESYKQADFILFGNGAIKAKALYSNRPNFKWFEQIQPNARSIGEIAFRKYQHSEFENLAYYEPNYLKEFKAIKPKPLV